MLKKHIQVAPSILAADFGYLADAAQKVQAAGADWLHIDVMDGHFVPNITMGPHIVAAINRATDMPLDVHLMIYNPFEYIEPFVKAGADRITFHFEATEEVDETIAYIRRCNVKAGLAFNPETSMSMIPKYLDKVDMILLMTVNPGFGGQAFMPEVIEKIKFTRDVCNRLRIGASGKTFSEEEWKQGAPPLDIQVDGGINDETAALCAHAGANVFVAGTALFKQSDLSTAIKRLREAATLGVAEEKR